MLQVSPKNSAPKVQFEDNEIDYCDNNTTVTLESDDAPIPVSKLPRLDAKAAYERVKMFIDSQAVEQPKSPKLVLLKSFHVLIMTLILKL